MTVLDQSDNQLKPISFTNLQEDRSQIFIQHDYAYLAGGNSLDIVNISDPMNPVLVSTNKVGQDGPKIEEIYIFGNNAYLALFDWSTKAGALYILDVSDPSSPSVISEIDDVVQDVFVEGNIAYLLTGHWMINALAIQLKCYDISDPSNPIEKGSVGAALGYSLYVSGNYAYIVSRLETGITVVDISNPENPIEVANYVGSDKIHQIVVIDQTGFAVDPNNFIMLDLSSPSSPAVISRTFLGEDEVIHRSLAVKTTGGVAQRVFIPRSGKLETIDVTTPESPIRLEPFANPIFVNSMDFYGDNLFVSDGTSIWRYELLDSIPIYQDRFDIENHFLLVGGDKLFVTDLEAHCTIFGLSDPANPQQKGTYTTYAAIRAMAANDTLAYIIPSGFLSGMNKLEVVDVKNPSNPAKIGQVDLANIGVDIFVPEPNDAGLVYVVYYDSTSGAGGMQIVDVNEPSAPAIVSTIATAGKPTCIWVEESLAYIGSMTGDEDGWFLEVFDVSNSQAPIMAASTNGTGTVIWDVTVVNGTILASFPEQGIRAFELASAQKSGLVNYDAILNSTAAFDIIESGMNLMVNDLLSMRTKLVGKNLYLFVNSGYRNYEGMYWDKNPYAIEKGSGGGYQYKIRPKNMCCISVQVEPEEARQAGCTASVLPVMGECGTPVIFTPNPAEGWQFDHVEGSLMLMGECPSGNQVTAYFKRIQPTLTLAGSYGAQQFCPCDSMLFEGVAILPISLSVDDVDSWIVHTVSFLAFGSGNEKKDIKKAKLYKNNIHGELLDEKSFSEDDMRITMNVHGAIIQPGGTLRLVLVYEFSEQRCDSLASSYSGSEFWAQINIDDVSAQPENYSDGLKLPPSDQIIYGGPLRIGAVWNTRSGETFVDIFGAIYNPDTRSGDTIKVCPGEYKESVRMDKAVWLISMEGAEKTIINAGDDRVLKIKGGEAGISGGGIDGFTFVSNSTQSAIHTDGMWTDFTFKNNRTLVDAIRFDDGQRLELSNNEFFNLDSVYFGDVMQMKFFGNKAIAGSSLIRIGSGYKNQIYDNFNFKIDISQGLKELIGPSHNSVYNNELTGVYIDDSPVNIVSGNTISNSSGAGVVITGRDAIGNTVEDNEIYSCKLEGIALRSTSNSQINGNTVHHNQGDGISLLFCIYGMNIHQNTIYSNGRHGVVVEGAKYVKVHNNVIKNHQQDGSFGIFVKDSRNARILSNSLFGNCTGIEVQNSPSTFIGLNNVSDALCLFTGIHLDHSSPEIFGNRIANNQGNGIFAENGANPVVRANNILGNTEFGLHNADAFVMIDAQSNWWGDGSGPQAKDISGNVDFTNWLTNAVDIIVSAESDSSFISIGQTDSVYCGLQNWENMNDVVDVTVEVDSMNWVAHDWTYNFALKDSIGAIFSIIFRVPSNVKAGASSKVKITAISQSDPTRTDVDSFYVVAYNRSLSEIMVEPARVLLRAGQSVQFRASGYDQVGKAVEVTVLWEATGGEIDSSGLFTAGSDTGSFFIRAEEPVQHIVDSAMVRILPMLAGVELSPDSVALEPGGAFQFQVMGYDSLGTDVEVLPVWSVAGGVIDANGLFTAGSDTGLFKVIVRDSLVELRDTAMVNIQTKTKVTTREQKELPTDFSLEQNYPNPFNTATTIEYAVKEPGHVLLKVFNVTGREVATLVDSDQQAGYYKVHFDASHFASGLYFYRIRMKDFVAVKKMLMLE